MLSVCLSWQESGGAAAHVPSAALELVAQQDRTHSPLVWEETAVAAHTAPATQPHHICEETHELT